MRLGACAGLLLAACGGRAASSGDAAGSGDAASSGDAEPASGGGAGGPGAAGSAAGSSGGGAASVTRTCPDESWGSCHAGLRLDLSTEGRTEGDEGVWAEPLQVALPPARTLPPPESPDTDPAHWDRSETPVGACVFRVHGAPAACLDGRASLSFFACEQGGPGRPVLASYYELAGCSAGVSPGCPGAVDPWGSQNFVWYSAREADGTATVVLCAALCEMLLGIGAACLQHAPGITVP